MYLDSNSKFMIVNGSNGTGKSTLMLTVAMNMVLAQMGCFVPCLSLGKFTFNLYITSVLTPYHVMF